MEPRGKRFTHLTGHILVLCPRGSVWVDVDAFEEEDSRN